VCNLYSITTNQAAIIALFRVINHRVFPHSDGLGAPYPCWAVTLATGGIALRSP
jgi:hypothetical protein